jgi:hypothetical protein
MKNVCGSEGCMRGDGVASLGLPSRERARVATKDIIRVRLVELLIADAQVARRGNLAF